MEHAWDGLLPIAVSGAGRCSVLGQHVDGGRRLLTAAAYRQAWGGLERPAVTGERGRRRKSSWVA